MTPPKPRITKKRLKWKLNYKRTAWEPYHLRKWTDGGKSREKAVKLDWKGDPQELDRLFWLCEAGQHQAQQIPKKHTWRECIIAWRTDPKGQAALAPSSRRSYRRAMDKIMMKNGDKEMTRTTPKALSAAHRAIGATTPREADRMLQTVSILWNYAKGTLFWPLGDNPASLISKFGSKREFEPWPAWMVEALQDAPIQVQTAAALIRGTGQRPSAAIKMRRDAFYDEWMTVTDEKGRQTFDVYAPDFLRDYIDQLPDQGAYIIAKNATQPLTYDAIEKRFRAWRSELGERARPYVLHGLRKLAIIELAEAGATDAEIQAVTGQSAEMVTFYRRKASRKALSRAAQKRREN